MKLPDFNVEWPSLWKESYHYDQLEFFGLKSNLGYTYAYLNRYNSIVNSVMKYLPTKSSIVDIAAAQGNFSLTLAEYGYKVLWNDLRSNLIDYVNLKFESGDIEFLSGNIFDLKISNKFDGVIITEIIEHVAHPDEFLVEVSNLVKDGGYIFMSTPLGSYFLNSLPKFSDCVDPSIYESKQFKPNSDGHIFLLHYEEIVNLAKVANLEIIDISVYNNSLTSGHIKFHYLLKLLPKKLVRLIEKLTRALPFFISKKLHANISVIFKKNN